MRGVFAICLLAAGFMPAAFAADSGTKDPATVRVATFNSSLNRSAEGGLIHDLGSGDDPQARRVAEIVQRVRPDILLLQEVDYDVDGRALGLFLTNYLGRSQADGLAPLQYAHSYSAPVNTGVPSGYDLDHDAGVSGPGDALGFGQFPGQYGMVVLSKYPIDAAQARTFRRFLWRDMPGAVFPRDWYNQIEMGILPLSSKSHWDLPVTIGKRTLHLLVSHPTPPAFDGPEDRNGRRNHDEIRFWVDYLSGGEGDYIRDDRGERGALRGKDFLVMGDLNSDPLDGASRHEAIRRLLQHDRVASDFVPTSPGAPQAARLQEGINIAHRTDARQDTADFNDRSAGNLRVDYLLPSRTFGVCGGGVFWPERDAPEARLVWGEPPPSSDHRLVWLDLSATKTRCPPGSGPKASAP
jgi:endonuclease/exonuclease/phosphatase family metal-dependent hydrolase